MSAAYPRVLAARIGFLLARAHLIARERADAALDELGLTMKGFAALATLVSDGPSSQQQLSRRIRMDPATMVDVIDELEGSGHIVRRRDRNDRRAYSLQPTAKGRALLVKAQRSLRAAEDEMVGSLKAGEAETLVDILGRIAGADRSEHLATEREIEGALGH